MTAKKKDRPSPLSWAGPFGLAALGQVFLVQQDIPWTLWVGLAGMAAALGLFLKKGKISRSTAPLSRGTEILLLAGILAAGAFFRFYRLPEFPAGVFPDDPCGA